MTARIGVLILVFTITAAPLIAAPVLERGDVLGVRETNVPDANGDPQIGAEIIVFSREGAFKGVLIHVDGVRFFDLFYRNGVIYVGSGTSSGVIYRVSESGVLLPSFTGVRSVYLSPGPQAGVLSASSGELFQLDASGTVIRQLFDPLFGRGIDLGADGCTLFLANARLARMNACIGDAPVLFGPIHPGAYGQIRVLPDGTFLMVSVTGGPALHLDAGGNVIRSYNLLTTGEALALDVEGTSFWTNATGCLTRVDIATGAILTSACGPTGAFLAVVGEPRAAFAAYGATDVPAASPMMLMVLVISLAVIAISRRRAMVYPEWLSRHGRTFAAQSTNPGMDACPGVTADLCSRLNLRGRHGKFRELESGMFLLRCPCRDSESAFDRRDVR